MIGDGTIFTDDGLCMIAHRDSSLKKNRIYINCRTSQNGNGLSGSYPLGEFLTKLGITLEDCERALKSPPTP
jgi:hypothetical protein